MVPEIICGPVEPKKTWRASVAREGLYCPRGHKWPRIAKMDQEGLSDQGALSGPGGTVTKGALSGLGGPEGFLRA